MYGCDESQKEKIIRQLDKLELAYNHPTLLPGLIAELERSRLIERVENLLDSFALRADNELDLNMDKTKMGAFLKLCYESRDLINQMKAVRRQSAKMVTQTARFGKSICPNRRKGQLPVVSRTQGTLRQAGQRINLRLNEISSEYDDRINDCNMVIDNMSLTMQTAS